VFDSSKPTARGDRRRDQHHGGTTIGDLAQNLVNLINATPALESADGWWRKIFLMRIRTARRRRSSTCTPARPLGGVPNAVTLYTSTNLTTTPADTAPLADNVSDLRRATIYVSAGPRAAREFCLRHHPAG